MIRHDMSSELRKADFLEKLLASDAVDPEGLHQEFGQGLHGQKVDFDQIGEKTDLFGKWVELVAGAIREYYPVSPDVLVGVANGTNRIIRPLSQRLGNQPLTFETVKKARSSPELNEISKKAIEIAAPSFVLVVEDIGTKGTNSLSVVRSVQETGVENIGVLNTLQRSPELELLLTHGISYRSILSYILPTYTPEGCREFGHCAQGWKLLLYGT